MAVTYCLFFVCTKAVLYIFLFFFLGGREVSQHKDIPLRCVSVDLPKQIEVGRGRSHTL